MPSVEVNGGAVVYEILGDTGDLVVLTPGGRFSKDVPGLRPLGERLVAGGYRVLLCGTVPTAAHPTCSSTATANRTCARRRCTGC